ncbi:MAG: two-component system response regulator [Verrucomicrobia bacterium]|nr:MAG: two-component system response regulator [Verrucomicrobiota bacterium]
MQTAVFTSATQSASRCDTRTEEAFTPVRVLLVDDSPHFLNAAIAFLSRHPQIQIVGSARSGLEAIQLVEQTSPDLVLMDVAMPQMNGLEATEQIKAQPAPPRVIILTLYDSPDCRESARSAGADGFVPKEEFGEDVLALIFRLFSLV